MKTVYLLVVALAIPLIAAGQQATDTTSAGVLGTLSQNRTDNVFTLNTDDTSDGVTWAFAGAQSGTKVDLDLKNATVAEALKELFSKSKAEYKLEDKDLPDTRISLSAKQVRFSTALDLIMQSSGLHYSVTVQNGKTTYRVGKKLSGSPNVFWNSNNATYGNALTFVNPGKNQNLYNNLLKVDPNINGPNGLWRNGLKSLTLDPNSALVYTLGSGENRATFICPHCKGQATVIRHNQPLKCPKCSRTFQGDWQFCPFDGAKRPASTGGWKFCPVCGKEVNMEKEEGRKTN